MRHTFRACEGAGQENRNCSKRRQADGTDDDDARPAPTGYLPTSRMAGSNTGRTTLQTKSIFEEHGADRETFGDSHARASDGTMRPKAHPDLQRARTTSVNPITPPRPGGTRYPGKDEIAAMKAAAMKDNLELYQTASQLAGVDVPPPDWNAEHWREQEMWADPEWHGGDSEAYDGWMWWRR